jgi:hypothetical protein
MPTRSPHAVPQLVHQGRQKVGKWVFLASLALGEKAPGKDKTPVKTEVLCGGGKEIRTPDLLNAIQTVGGMLDCADLCCCLRKLSF